MGRPPSFFGNCSKILLETTSKFRSRLLAGELIAKDVRQVFVGMDIAFERVLEAALAIECVAKEAARVCTRLCRGERFLDHLACPTLSVRELFFREVADDMRELGDCMFWIQRKRAIGKLSRLGVLTSPRKQAGKSGLRVDDVGVDLKRSSIGKRSRCQFAQLLVRQALVVVSHGEIRVFGQGFFARANRLIVTTCAAQAPPKRIENDRIARCQRTSLLEICTGFHEATVDFIAIGTQVEQNRMPKAALERLTRKLQRTRHVLASHRGVDVEVDLGRGLHGFCLLACLTLIPVARLGPKSKTAALWAAVPR